MELWIRTGSRTGLVAVKDIYIHSREGMYTIESKYFVLGMYKTEERALEVLNEIQCHLANIKDSMDICFYVYEMPQK